MKVDFRLISAAAILSATMIGSAMAADTNGSGPPGNGGGVASALQVESHKLFADRGYLPGGADMRPAAEDGAEQMRANSNIVPISPVPGQ